MDRTKAGSPALAMVNRIIDEPPVKRKRKYKIAVIAIESVVKYSFVLKSMETRRKGQYNAELTFSPRLCSKPLTTAITAIKSHT